MIRQFRPISYNTCTTLVGMLMVGVAVQYISGKPLWQFYCEPKTALKKSILKNKY
jgi:hypothetical protein